MRLGRLSVGHRGDGDAIHIHNIYVIHIMIYIKLT